MERTAHSYLSDTAEVLFLHGIQRRPAAKGKQPQSNQIEQRKEHQERPPSAMTCAFDDTEHGKNDDKQNDEQHHQRRPKYAVSHVSSLGLLLFRVKLINRSSNLLAPK